jgi:signal transduction histidine kinase
MNLLEEKYRAFLKNLNVERLRIGTLLAIVLVPAGISLDYFTHPEHLKTFLILRLVCTAISFLVLAITYTKFGLTHALALGVFETSNVAIMLAVMIRYLGYETEYYAGLNLVILAIGVLFPWNLKETVFACGLIYGYYLVPILLFDDISNAPMFMNNNLFLLETAIIACTSSYFTSSLRRRAFVAQDKIEQNYHALQDLDRLKTRFFANISHELRTPITLLLGPTEMMIKRELGSITENQEKYLRVIHTHSTRLLRLINNLLHLSKVDAGETKLLLSRGNFVQFVKKTVHSINPVAEKRSIHLSFEGDERIPEFLYDPEKMEDIVLNLLSNALKFTERGEICVSCKKEQNDVLVKISDTGIGIPKESIPKLFDRFFQVDTEASRVGAGTGIGLSLVKEWVELHKGKIWVESEERKGSSFFFTIPIRWEEGVDIPEVVEKRERKISDPSVSFLEAQVGLDPAKETERREKIPFREGVEKILLVDDNADMLHFMSDQLKNDYNLLFARDGEEGIQETRTWHPDLIISDIMMPVKDGYQLCRELKEYPETSTIPIIFLTAKGALSDKIEGLEQGADDYLTKPFNREELRARVVSLLHKRKLQQEIAEKNKQLEEALETLKRIGRDLAHTDKMRALGLLTAGVAHEINNPISFAKGSLSVAQNCFDKMKQDALKMGTQEQSAILSTIEASLNIVRIGLLRSETIVRNLTLFAQKGAPSQRVNLSVCLDTTLELTRHEWSPKIKIHRGYEEGVFVEGFSDQLNQAVLNILQNAIQSIEKQGEIFIAMRQGAEEIVVSIRDTGRGIVESDLPRVFEPFFTTRTLGKGTGLGLAITYKIIVETHHGKLDIKSKEGEGTEVMITLPVSRRNI